MDIRFQLQVRLSFLNNFVTKMAIAFTIDPERGYVPVNNVQQQQQSRPLPVVEQVESRVHYLNGQRHNNNNRRHVNLNIEIDENNNHVIPDLIHGVANFPMMMGALGQSSQSPPSSPPPRSLSRERVTMTSLTTRGRYNFIARLPMAWLSIKRLLRCFSWQSPSLSSEPFTSDGPSSDSEGQGESLPDIIPCHHGFSLDVSFESCRVYGSRRNPIVTLDENINNETPRQRCRRPAGRYHHPIPLVPTNHPSHILDPDDDEWNIELKVELNPRRQVGEDLRRIGDQFQFEFESSIQRSPQRESFHVRCVLTLTTLPTLALVGVMTGLAYLRRHI